MDYNKAEILKKCRELLHLINCEIVVDISDGQLFNVLFQSDVKKETLLNWLMQQMFSMEECTNNSIENLASMFIPKSQFRSFLIGTMPIAEQYKKWKLIMSVLHKKQQRKNIVETIDYTQELLNGSLLEEYKRIWSEKFDFNPKYISSSNEQPKKININEIQADLDRCKSQLAQLKSEEKTTKRKQYTEEDGKISNVFEEYKHAIGSLNEAVDKELLPHLNATRNFKQYSLRYNDLDATLVKNVTKNAQILHNSIEAFNNVLQGVENLGSTQQQNNTDLN